jgi:hypothetical protein
MSRGQVQSERVRFETTGALFEFFTECLLGMSALHLAMDILTGYLFELNL